MSRIEDFKSRMNDLKLYKNTTGKGYWDWKALLFAEGGELYNDPQSESTKFIGPITEELYKDKQLLHFKELYRPKYLKDLGNKAKVNPDFANYIYDFDFNQVNSKDEKEHKYLLRNYSWRATNKRIEESDKYTTPYVPEKEVMLTTGRFNTGRISTNVLDSLLASSKRTGYPFEDYLGLAARESGLGYARLHKKLGKISNTALMSNWQLILTVINTAAAEKKYIDIYNKFLNEQQITQEELDFVKKYIENELKEYNSTKPITENVFDNAIKVFESGKYNPNDLNYMNKVRLEGRMLMNDPAIKKWRNTVGLSEGGEVKDNNSIAIEGETDYPDVYTDERTDHPIAVRLNLDRNINVANFTDRINHIDPNVGEYNPFYSASDDTYGTVPLSEITVTAPWTQKGRNNAAARRGMHYVQQGLEDAAKVAAPIVAGAVLPAIASTGALGTIVDLASIVTNPTDPLNYLPYAKYLDKYIFLRHTNSFTRGIGGEQGLQDLIESGLVRGNPIGTEITANNFAKKYRKNRDYFRDIVDGTKREGIHNRYYNRTLSRDDFNAIKKLAELFEDSYILHKVGKFNLTPKSLDPLYRYEDYDDYLQVLKHDRQTLQNATSLDDSGLPLAYFYDDGRNPITEGHDYAKSIYGVRVNNASSYNPRIFEGHLHYSFPQAISLYDPNVEVFKRGFLGITTKINKNKLYRYLNNSNGKGY